MSKTRARQRAKARPPVKAAKKMVPAEQPDQSQPARRFDSGAGAIKGPFQAAAQSFPGAKSRSARSR